MAQLDVHTRRSGGAGYLLDVQSELLSGLNTRFVIPLLPEDEAPKPARRLNPIFEVMGVRHVLATQFAAAVSAGELGAPVMNVAEHHEAVIAALDVLITGV